MNLLPLLLFACSTAPQTLVSEPTTPTVELGGDVPQSEITWSELEGLLPEGEPAVPAAVNVTLGQPEVEARAAFERARHQKLPHPADQERDGVSLMAGHLQAFPVVGATLMFHEGVLFAVDLSLPKEEAGFATNQMWGEPDRQIAGKQGVPRPTWEHDGVQALLIELEDENVAILKFTKGN